MRRKHRVSLAVLMLGVLALLTGCGGVSSNAAQSSAKATVASAGSLEGTKWRLQSLGAQGAEKTVEGNATLLLQFDPGGKLSGNGGCNTFGGSYKVNGQTIAFSDLVNTLRACADETISNQESRYFKALQQATRFTLAGDSLVIEYGAGKTVLNFVRVSGS